MDGFFGSLMQSDFMPHGHCYAWRPEILWLHVVSDTLIALSYYSIPLTLLYFVRKRQDLPFNWMFMMFGAFILLCGTTHVLEVWTVWHGTYRLTGVVKLITAGVSAATAVALIPLIPRALALPSPEALRHEVEERRKAECELMLARDRLEEQVERRTAELKSSNQKLARAYMDVRRSNRELEEFVRVASHDLQEPLRKIGVFSDRIRMRFGESLGEQGIDYLNRMQKASVRMSALLRDLLSLSRVGSGAISFESVNLAEVAANVVQDLEIRIEEARAEVVLSHLPRIMADPIQMRVLFQNLIGNGIKFRAPDRPPVVRVSARLIENEESGDASGSEAEPAPRPRIEILFEDNGIGFDSAHAELIFEVFQRLHTREEYDGSGIGLAICRKIAHRHGGGITAEGRPGEGSVFRVTLACEPSARDEEPEPGEEGNEE